MWWEILYPTAIIATLLTAPFYTTYFSHKLLLGKWCKRPRMDNYDKVLFERDEDLSGHNFAYDTRGLDALPDEPINRFPFTANVNPGKLW